MYSQITWRSCRWVLISTRTLVSQPSSLRGARWRHGTYHHALNASLHPTQAGVDALRSLFAASAQGGPIRDTVHLLLEEGLIGRLIEIGSEESPVTLQLSVLLALEALVLVGKPADLAEYASEHGAERACFPAAPRWR